jgi:hypothetical protein
MFNDGDQVIVFGIEKPGMIVGRVSNAYIVAWEKPQFDNLSNQMMQYRANDCIHRLHSKGTT